MSKKPNKKKLKKELSKKSLKIAILSGLKETPTKKVNYKQVSKFLKIKKLGEKLLVYEALSSLVQEGSLVEQKRGSFVLALTDKLIEGVVKNTNKRGVYVELKNEEEVFVEKKDSLFSLKGDVVSLVLLTKKRGEQKGIIRGVVTRKKNSFVGVIQQSNSFSFFIPDDYRVYFDVFIPPKEILKNIENKKVHVTITNWDTENKNPVGKITSVLGSVNDHETEINSILIEGGFESSFSKIVEEKANSIDKKIALKEALSRLDLRKTATFTIDPEDAKDFDDAISVKQLQNKNWEVGVHIADVSHYIKEGDSIDKEALSRGTSVYMVDRVIPMLPEILSNDLCSLKPNEDKLCFSVIFEFNNSAEIVNYKISKTIIHSNKRFSYEQAQKNINSKSGLFYKELIHIKDLSLLLRNRRKENGSINLKKQKLGLF